MYEAHQEFDTPAPATKIWRYLDFTKLVAMLESSSLYFTSVATLEDKFEGAYTHRISQHLSVRDPEESVMLNNQYDKAHRNIAQLLRPTMYVNCWHMNIFESAAMWKIYLKSNEGVAISSTIESLTKSFRIQEPIYVGKVHYLDYRTEEIRHGNFFRPFIRKRSIFDYENELRALFWDVARYTSLNQQEMITPDGIKWKPEVTFDPGRDIAVDLNTLIEEIYVSPTAPTWFYKLVEATLKTYKFLKEVKRSSLLEEPSW